MTSDDPDPRTVYEALRISTAQLLNLDADNLSPADGLKLDLTSLLRLTLDGLQGAALAGREIDLGKLQSCYAMLQKLLPQAIAAPVVHESSAARRRLAELIDAIAEVEADEKDARIAELQTLLAEKTSALAAVIGEVASKPAAPPTPDSKVSPATNVAPDQPMQTSPQPPLPSSKSGVPQNYLKTGSEPWRRFVEGGRMC